MCSARLRCLCLEPPARPRCSQCRGSAGAGCLEKDALGKAVSSAIQAVWGAGKPRGRPHFLRAWTASAEPGVSLPPGQAAAAGSADGLGFSDVFLGKMSSPPRNPVPRPESCILMQLLKTMTAAFQATLYKTLPRLVCKSQRVKRSCRAALVVLLRPISPPSLMIGS